MWKRDSDFWLLFPVLFFLALIVIGCLQAYFFHSVFLLNIFAILWFIFLIFAAATLIFDEWTTSRRTSRALVVRPTAGVHHLHIADQGKLFRWYLGMKCLPYGWRVRLYHRDQQALHADYAHYLRERKEHRDE